MSSSLRETTIFFELSLLPHEAAAIFVLLSQALCPDPALQTSTQFPALFRSGELDLTRLFVFEAVLSSRRKTS